MADRLTSERCLRRLALGLAGLAFAVIVLGAWVRLTGAGLGCPDWPGCYGRMVVGPDEAALGAGVDRGKAWREMLHRYAAGALGLGIVLLALLAVRNRRRTGAGPIALPAGLVVLVAFQAALGAWTVTLRLQPAIVVAHLLGGLAVLGGLWRLALGPRPPGGPARISPRPSAADPDTRATDPGETCGPEPSAPSSPERPDGDAPRPGTAQPACPSRGPPATPADSRTAKSRVPGSPIDAARSTLSRSSEPPTRRPGVPATNGGAAERGPPIRFRAAAAAGVAVLAVQIALGGWTSANYAALACPDLPTCRGSWWPDADYAAGFRLWQESGTGFEGGVLDSRARTAIHFVHRIGAAVTFAYLAGLCGAALRRGGADRGLAAAGASVLGLLVLQAGLGISNVWLGLPLAAAIAHNAGAALLLLALLTMHHRSDRPA